MLEPTLVESQEGALVVFMINFHLLSSQFLNGLIVFLAFKGESNFFDVIEEIRELLDQPTEFVTTEYDDIE